MQVDYLIIGQGISGTWLSYYLQKEGKAFLVVDNNDKNAASRLAAGVINPVTGRRHAEVWMAKEILPYSLNAYSALGSELNIEAISQKNIIDLFPSPQMKVSFMQRVEEDAEYVHTYAQQDRFRSFFNYDFGCGEIRPVYTVHLETLLPAWRKELVKRGSLLEEKFEMDELEVTSEKIIYKNITAGKIIFCDGNSSTANPWFDLLPFAPNKGEVLIVSIPGLPADHIYKRGMMLVPLASNDLWWLGSSYAWKFDHAEPTIEFREKTTALLNEWLKISFSITAHLSGVRPATLERRPFIGLHPLNAHVGILNGMGTKGCSLAPFFAKQLVDHLCHGKALHPDVDINRFQRILSRKN